MSVSWHLDFQVCRLPFDLVFSCRRKLDSIITKLHKTTPLGKEGLGDKENQVNCLSCCRCCVSSRRSACLYMSEWRSILWQYILSLFKQPGYLHTKYAFNPCFISRLPYSKGRLTLWHFCYCVIYPVWLFTCICTWWMCVCRRRFKLCSVPFKDCMCLVSN